MSFDVIATKPFERKVKRLAKKYKTFASDLANVIEVLSENPLMGTQISKDCYKIRIAITSKGRGKSGGVRLITYVRIVSTTVYLLDIYDKSEQSNITDKELKMLIDILAVD
ncbi:MAG: type II toxin-antitoxin system RelE/ParE family toxin [Paludibacter sp.]|nr:type II toxin-antitoxin system RelE/ParE family toxin [Paludibacter sp.]